MKGAWRCTCRALVALREPRCLFCNKSYAAAQRRAKSLRNGDDAQLSYLNDGQERPGDTLRADGRCRRG
jgi:hypothetical protein